ncbi:MAG: TRAP transporter small permease [Dehalococcoidales bacterium]|nr:TRAP transporter small permease [Dehalococcoidales bacterium]
MVIYAMGEKLEKVIYSMSRGFRVLSIAMLFIMMLFVTVDVIGRYIINKPINGDIELQELMMVVIIFGAMAYATTTKQHVFVELLVARLKGRSLAIVNSIALFLGLVFLALTIWRTGVGGWNEMMSPTGKYTMMLEIPIAPFILLADVGLILMFLVFLCQFIKVLNSAIGLKHTDIFNNRVKAQ